MSYLFCKDCKSFTNFITSELTDNHVHLRCSICQNVNYCTEQLITQDKIEQHISPSTVVINK